MRKVLTALFLVWALAAWAQSQVATVTSSAPFTLRGASVTPGQGVPSWPILAGDDLKAGSQPVVVTFPDGSVTTLAAGSEAKIDFVKGKPVFQLISGSAGYSLKSTSAVQLMAGAQPTSPKGLVGTFNVAGGVVGVAPAGLSEVVLGVLILGAGAAAGIAGGIAEANSGGPSVSPN